MSRCSLRSLRCSLVAAVFLGSGTCVTQGSARRLWVRLLLQIGGTNMPTIAALRREVLAPLAAQLEPLVAFEAEVERGS